MSQYGFQITEEDVVQTVLNKFLLDITEKQANLVLNKLDLQKVENEALEGLEMDEQTDLAYTEIARQIKEGNLFAGIVG